MRKLLFFGAILITNFTIAQIPNDPLGYWPFNGTANDESGNGNNGNGNNDIYSTDRNGNQNSSLDCSNGDVTISLPTELINFSGEFSYWIYFKTGNQVSNLEEIIRCNGSTTAVIFTVRNNDFYVYVKDDGGNGILAQYLGLTIQPNTYYFVGCNRHSNGDVDFWVNNEIVFQGNCPGTISNIGEFYFCSRGGAQYFFTGKIDDIRIHNRALTEQEIAALYNEGGESTPPPTTNTWQSNGNNIYYDGTGNVGIGTDNPAAKLTVNGPILSTEVKVKTDVSTYPDFVFKPEYKLRTLVEVEQYINERGHLPEIPKAIDVEEGVNLGEMNAKLLQKIEELTLYTIEQNKAIEELKQTVKQQNEKITKLELKTEQ